MKVRATIAMAAFLLGVMPGAFSQQTNVLRVGVVTAEKRPVSDAVRFVGRIEAVERVDVRARVTGFLENILFKDGEQVKANAPLYQIEKGPFEAAVQQAQAAVVRTQAQLDNASLQRQRADDLIRTNAIAEATRDDRVMAEKSAQGNLAAAQADLKSAEINLAYTEIKSPIDGRVGRTAVTRGNVVGPNSGVLTTIVSADPMYVVFPVSQREFLGLADERKAKGASAKDFKVIIQFSNGATYDQAGEIDFVDVKVDKATDAVTVRAKIPNPKSELVDGQLVQVSVERDKQEEKVIVPQVALIADQQGTYVFAVENGEAVVKRLKLAGTKGAGAIVQEGLSGGEAIVVQGAQNLKPGAAVVAEPVQLTGF